MASETLSRFRFSVAGALACMSAVVGACSLFGGQASDSTQLNVGDCFDQPAQVTDSSGVERRTCAEPHAAEVIAKTAHPAVAGAAYPTVDELRGFMQATCMPAFGDYTGSSFVPGSGMDFGLFYPLEPAWNNGERGVTCYVFRVDGSKFNGSLRDAAPSS
jgi:hypothetical protein